MSRLLDRLTLPAVLRLDAAASGAMGLLLLAAASPLAATLALPAWLLREAGVALMPWTALLLWLARRPRPSRAALGAVAAVNAAWVAGSLLVLELFRPSALGVAFTLAQAAAVAAFAALQGAAAARVGGVARA